jgi:hypothetical protein
MDDQRHYRYASVRDHALPLVRAVVERVLTSQKLDAIVYPTAPRRPALIVAPPDVPRGRTGVGRLVRDSTGGGQPKVDRALPRTYSG